MKKNTKEKGSQGKKITLELVKVNEYGGKDF